MIEAHKTGYAPVEASEAGQTYSKDYWDLVFEQLGRRPLFKLGVAVLALLYATAVYAPLIANDRPLVLYAIDYKDYKNASRSMSAVGSVAARLLAAPLEVEGAPKAGGVSAQAGAAEDPLAVQLRAARERIATMELYLDEATLAPLRDFEQLFLDAIAAREAGDLDGATAMGEELKTRSRAFRDEFKARDPSAQGAAAGAAPSAGDAGSEAEPEGLVLNPVRSYPLLESISHWEIFFMTLWAMVLTWPVWNRVLNRFVLAAERGRIRSWRKRKLATVLGIAALSAVVWANTVAGETATFDTAPFKLGLTRGDIIAEVPPLFPLLPYGYAETHPEENFRPPTWTAKAHVDAEGRFTHSSRAPEPDPVTGYLPPATPVDLRAGEPDVNAGARHPAGTDELGRDFLVRMVWGGRVSLSVGILSAILLTVIGVVVGACAGYFGGRVDMLIMRVIEIVQSIPAFFLILLVMAFTDPNVVPPIIAIVVVIAAIRWTGAARLVRGEFLRLREQEFVLASRALGFSSLRTIFRHVLPNALSPVLVNAAFAVAAGILTESAISFLGFGIAHPGASWGSLVNESKSADHWWVQFFPGLLIFVTVTCYNLVGDAVRDALDPKMKV